MSSTGTQPLMAGPPKIRLSRGFTTARLCSGGSYCHVLPHHHRSDMRPSDSLAPIGLGSGSPRLRPTSWKVSPSSRVFMCTLKTPSPSEIRSRFPVDRHNHEETTGSPRLLGRPLRTCHGHLPRRPCRPHRPLAVTVLLPSGPPRPWALPGFPFRWLSHHGPHARLPTHQRRRYRRRCKAGYRPAGLSSSRAGFAPAGRLFRISRWHRRPPIPTDQHCLVASEGGNPVHHQCVVF